jgi:nicotinamide-nucleotide adenylyltransferase
MRSLVIGRFQPLHLGHLKMLEYSASKSTYLVLGLGSCNESGTWENPFTAEERGEMIKQSLVTETPYEIKRIPDFEDDAKWIQWIMENLSFDVFMTNALPERRIFEEAGLKVLDVPFFERKLYSATEVRNRILEGQDWRGLLPDGTLKVLDEIGGEERIRKLKN